jgi:iron complex outermembrane receptor protein
VANADDGFGTSVGLETTGIYTEQDARGFSPIKAGNLRVDGIYFDIIGTMPSRLKQSTGIRIGFAADSYPFQAPTGIVDQRLRPFPEKNGISLGANLISYGGQIGEIDLRLRNQAGTLGLIAGFAYSDFRYGGGSQVTSYTVAARPIIRIGGIEIAPWAAKTIVPVQQPHVLTIVSGDTVPAVPRQRLYLGQNWTRTRLNNDNFGIIAKVPITSRLLFRGGMNYSNGDRERNFSEFYILPPGGTLASHRVIADPPHRINSTSGEAQLSYRFGKGRWQHRVIAGFRMRSRLTETGGSQPFDFDTVDYDKPDPEPQPVFAFAPVNSGLVKQSAVMLGYLGRLPSVGHINLGVQKARFRASNRNGTNGVVTASRDDPWLYNATVGIKLTSSISIYLGTQRGLEDSGTAPDLATNRNEQLPPTRTTQYDGGIRWKFGGGQFVINAFQITKPYFSYDTSNLFTRIGDVRHRGIEASLSGHFGKRLQIVAGALALQPRVSNFTPTAGLQGELPTGTPSKYVRIDSNYKTDIFGGLTLTAGLQYTGTRAVSAKPFDSPGGKQLMLPGVTAIDIGVRRQFTLGGVPMNLRAVLANVFDHTSWKVLAPNVLDIDERRRFSLTLVADL